jgi:hypothetical protein
MIEHYFQQGSNTLIRESGYLSWIFPREDQSVDYELCAAISAMSVKLSSPLVKNTALVVPTGYEFKRPHLKPVWNHILEWNFDKQNFWKSDVMILKISPFKYTMRLDSDVIVTSSWIDEIWHQIWRLGYAVSKNIANLNSNICNNPYRSHVSSPWQRMNLPHAYVAVMGVNTQHRCFQTMLRSWEWACWQTQLLKTNGSQHVDSDELLSLSFIYNNLVLHHCAFFVHAKPLCLFDSPVWPSTSNLVFANQTWRLSHIPQHLPIHMAEKSLLNEKLAQQIWSAL